MSRRRKRSAGKRAAPRAKPAPASARRATAAGAAGAAAEDAAAADAEDAAGVEGRVRPEAWASAAFAIALLALACAVFLLARPGGRAPIAVYRVAPIALPLAAFVVLAVALVRSSLRRPFLQRRRILPFLCLIAVAGAPQLPLPYPTPHEGRPSATCFRLPVDGVWTVVWGGEDLDANRLARFEPDRRYGLHLVVERDGRTHEGDGSRPQDHFAFGAKVLAPCDATVVRAVDGVPDGAIGARSAADPFGNHLVLEVAPAEFLFLTQLRAGSIAVAAGARVAAGQQLAEVGSSGWSAVTPEPHLSLHLQDTPEAHRGEAIPWRFCSYRSNGAPVERGLPRGGVGRARGGTSGARLGELVGERVEHQAPLVR